MHSPLGLYGDEVKFSPQSAHKIAGHQTMNELIARKVFGSKENIFFGNVFTQV